MSNLKVVRFGRVVEPEKHAKLSIASKSDILNFIIFFNQISSIKKILSRSLYCRKVFIILFNELTKRILKKTNCHKQLLQQQQPQHCVQQQLCQQPRATANSGAPKIEVKVSSKVFPHCEGSAGI